MAKLIALARLLAGLLGQDFDQEWACWESNPDYRPLEPHAAVCSWSSTVFDLLVYEAWDGSIGLMLELPEREG